MGFAAVWRNRENSCQDYPNVVRRISINLTNYINPKKCKTINESENESIAIFHFIQTIIIQFHDFFFSSKLDSYVDFNVYIPQDTSPLWGYKFTENRTRFFFFLSMLVTK